MALTSRLIVSVLALAALTAHLGAGSKANVHQFLSQLIERSPGGKDVYNLLNERQRAEWDYNNGLSTINETIAAVSSVAVELLVEVRLVGMAGDGHSQLDISPAALFKYLATLHGKLETVALQPLLRSVLPLAPNVRFSATHAPAALRQQIDTAIQQGFTYARNHPDPNVVDPMLLVPHGNVDSLIRADWEMLAQQRGAGRPSFTLYVLNPADTSQHYAYSYNPPLPVQATGQRKGGGPLGDAGSCPGNVWSAPQPYAWIDIAAGPLLYGPGPGHQGQVLGHSLPRPDMYHSDAASQAIVPDLAALVWSATKHLVWPPLHTANIRYYDEVIVQVVHMHDTLAPPSQHLDLGVLTQQLRAAVPQVADVREAWVSFAKCDLCVAAFTASLKVRTARELSSSVVARSVRFLDRQLLHTLMQRYRDKVLAYANLHTDDAAKTPTRHILPVFIFDLSQEDVLLLDDEGRAASFPDMVLAVTTKSKAALDTHFTCVFQHVLLDGGDITREVLASTLQAGWGVAHTAAYHSTATGENANYLWSVGNTPFGPLSGLPSLSATQTQAALRNQVAVLLDSAAQRIITVMEAFGELCPNGNVDCVLGSRYTGMLRRRVNLYLYKSQRAAEHLAAWDARKALPFARSSIYDAGALEQLAGRGAADFVDTKFSCEGHIETWHFVIYPTLAMLAWIAALVLRLSISRPKRSKQY